MIGDIAFVGVPGEFFTVLGQEIKRRSPFRYTYVFELANDYIGYIPDKAGFDRGGYQTWTGLHSFLERGTGELIVDEAVGLLDRLHQEPASRSKAVIDRSASEGMEMSTVTDRSDRQATANAHSAFRSRLDDLPEVDSESTGARFAYDHGVLEIMAPGPLHESDKELMGQFVRIVARTLRIAVSTWVQRPGFDRGRSRPRSRRVLLFRSREDRRGRRGTDGGRMIPPITPPRTWRSKWISARPGSIASRSMRALRVAEIWRFDGESLSSNGWRARARMNRSRRVDSYRCRTPKFCTGSSAKRSPIAPAGKIGWQQWAMPSWLQSTQG